MNATKRAWCTALRHAHRCIVEELNYSTLPRGSPLHCPPAFNEGMHPLTSLRDFTFRYFSVASEPQALPAQYEPSNAPVVAGYQVAPQSVFAVVEVGGTQYKVTPDDVIVTEKLEGVDVNEKLRLKRVLLLGSTAETVIGRPYVPGAEVVASVEEHFLDGKVLIFHKRRRKNSRRLNGHRQPLTRLRILSVHGIEEESVVD